jgi:hypothetical protein
MPDVSTINIDRIKIYRREGDKRPSKGALVLMGPIRLDPYQPEPDSAYPLCMFCWILGTADPQILVLEGEHVGLVLTPDDFEKDVYFDISDEVEIHARLWGSAPDAPGSLRESNGEIAMLAKFNVNNAACFAWLTGAKKGTITSANPSALPIGEAVVVPKKRETI